MKINDLFINSYSVWRRCGKYEVKESKYGRKYITAADTEAEFYDILENPESIVIDALNTALIVMEGKSNKSVRESILSFTDKYGLLGLINALPGTVGFSETENIYFPKNHFINVESMQKDRYIKIFFPFERPAADWIYGNGSPPVRDMGEMLYALPGYAEPYEWIVRQFKDWAYLLMNINYDSFTGISIRGGDPYLQKQTLRCFNSLMPEYIIEYNAKPELIWNFTSLRQVIDLLIKTELTDEVSTVSICPRCLKVFKTARQNKLTIKPLCCGKCMDEINICPK